MPTIRELITKFTVIADESPITRINSRLDDTKGKVGAVGASASKVEVLTHAFQALGAILASLAIIETLKKIEETADRYGTVATQLLTTAESLGITIEQFQALTIAAKGSAVSQEQLSTSMMRLTRVLYEAKRGGAQAMETFAHLGVRANEIAGLHNASEALLLLSSRVQALPNQIDKLALVQKTLGRGSMEMVAFLSQGPEAIREKMGEAGREGLILTEKQAQSLKHIHLELEKFGEKWHQIVATILVPLEPIIVGIVEESIKLYNIFEKSFGPTIHAWVMKLLYNLSFLRGFLEGFIDGIAIRFGGKKHGIFGEVFGDFVVFSPLIVAALVAIAAPIYALYKTIMAIKGVWALLASLGGGGAAAEAGAVGVGAAGAAEAGAAGAGLVGAEAAAAIGTEAAIAAVGTEAAAAVSFEAAAATYATATAAGAGATGIGLPIAAIAGVAAVVFGYMALHKEKLKTLPLGATGPMPQPQPTGSLVVNLNGHGLSKEDARHLIHGVVEDHHKRVMTETKRAFATPRAGG